MRANRRFLAKWGALLGREATRVKSLPSPLRRIVESRFAHSDGALVLEALARNATGPAAFSGVTEYEAFANKIHIEYWVPREGSPPEVQLDAAVHAGVCAARILAARLRSRGRYRVLLAIDEDSGTVTLRFFRRRAGARWGPENPDELEEEGVLIIDS